MEIRNRNAKKEEMLKEMWRRPVIKGGSNDNCILDLVVKAIFKLVSISNNQIRVVKVLAEGSWP